MRQILSGYGQLETVRRFCGRHVYVVLRQGRVAGRKNVKAWARRFLPPLLAELKDGPSLKKCFGVWFEPPLPVLYYSYFDQVF